MGYMCLTCGKEYYKEALNLNTPTEIYSYRCPSTDCGDLGVVEIDDMIMPIIKVLNQKGYKTKFCCSGHYYENNTNTYISFDELTIPKIFPKGFVIENREYYKQHNWTWYDGQICIRKWYKYCDTKYEVSKEILKTMLVLSKWVENLPFIDKI